MTLAVDEHYYLPASAEA